MWIRVILNLHNVLHICPKLNGSACVIQRLNKDTFITGCVCSITCNGAFKAGHGISDFLVKLFHILHLLPSKVVYYHKADTAFLPIG